MTATVTAATVTVATATVTENSLPKSLGLMVTRYGAGVTAFGVLSRRYARSVVRHAVHLLNTAFT